MSTHLFVSAALVVSTGWRRGGRSTISGVLCASSKPPCTHHVAEATALATQLRGLLLSEPAIAAAAETLSGGATHPEDIACAREAAVDAITAALGAIA